MCVFFFFFFQAEDGIRDIGVTGVQTCALPIFLRFLAVLSNAVFWITSNLMVTPIRFTCITVLLNFGSRFSLARHCIFVNCLTFPLGVKMPHNISTFHPACTQLLSGQMLGGLETAIRQCRGRIFCIGLMG